jgi:hypothetical protein
MAACAMRGIRYIAFPPVVFEAPAPVVAPVAEEEPAPPAVTPPVVAPSVRAPAPRPPLPTEEVASEAAPVEQAPPWLADADAEPAPPPRLRRLAELSAAATLTQPEEGAPPRRYALLNDIAVELRPRRPRARTGRMP